MTRRAFAPELSVAARIASIGLIVGAVVTCARPSPPVVSSARREAVRLVALQQEAALHMRFEAAMRATLDAIAADPTYVPAYFALRRTTPPSGSWDEAQTLDSTANAVPDSGLRACFRATAGFWRGHRVSPRSGALSPEANACFAVLATQTTFDGQDVDIARLRRLIAAFPDEPWIASSHFGVLAGLQKWRELAELAEARTHHESPLMRVVARGALSQAFHSIGNDSAAERVELDVRRDPAWRLPGYRILWANYLGGHTTVANAMARTDMPAYARHADTMIAFGRGVSLAVAGEGDLQARLDAWMRVFTTDLDRGHLEEAATGLRRAVAVADSLGDPAFRSHARMRYGRALVKRGRAAEAERFLLDARVIADAVTVPIIQKEIEHNLLHLYESQGRDADAFRAGEAFAHHAAFEGLTPVRMMSARDVGIFLRARGRLTESRPYFARMLADIDSLQREWFYAGEYHEVSGNLDSARVLYERALSRDDEGMRALDGLVRVALAMGDTARARARAAEHDARRNSAGRPESAPLLPRVMTALGTPTEARLAFGVARAEVKVAGQVAAWAALTTDLAAFEADHGNFARVVPLADSAMAAASSVGNADLARRARSLSAFGRFGLSPSAGALADLLAVAREGERAAPLQDRAELVRLAASALTASGRWREALAWFRRAAAPLDSAAALIALEPRQAAYRSAQRRVYDEALQTIVGHRDDPGAIPAWIEWSTRRKGRAYATDVVEAGAPTRPPAGTLIVDYALLDTVVAALMVGPQGSTIVRLPASPRAVVSAATAMHRSLDARVGSSIDVRRARFPMQRAAELYQMLLEPVVSRAPLTKRLVIVPDGIIGIVPFDALLTNLPVGDTDEARARFVIDQFIVEGASTVRRQLGARSLAASPIRVIATDDAPAAGGETAAILDALPAGRVSVSRGAAATPGSALEAARKRVVVHFAAHAEANEGEPAASYIALSADANGNGRLGAAEVSARQLHAALVILSACETASGRVLDGEGVLSLSRAFLRAGAEATIATLWPVGEASAEFAGAFYSNLARSGDAPIALRDAKLEMRARGTPAFAWAPYQFYTGPAANRRDAKPLALQR